MAERARGKPRQGKGPVLASAVRNFTERGYHGTSMRDIARDADVTVASIYHHFPSKQDVLQEIMQASMSEVISLTRSAFMAADNRREAQLAALVRAFMLWHTERREEALIGASEIRSLDAVGRKIVVALRDEQQRMFDDVIDRGVADGVFVTPFPREASRAVINMCYSVATWYTPAGDVPPREMAERYVALALSTVGAHQVHQDHEVQDARESDDEQE